ncbi:MAG: phage tail tip lysozyme [Blautia producta]
MLYLLLGIITGLGVSCCYNFMWSKNTSRGRTFVIVCSFTLVFGCLGASSTWSAAEFEPLQETYPCKVFDTKQVYQTNREEKTVSVLLTMGNGTQTVTVQEDKVQFKLSEDENASAVVKGKRLIEPSVSERFWLWKNPRTAKPILADSVILYLPCIQRVYEDEPYVVTIEEKRIALEIAQEKRNERALKKAAEIAEQERLKAEEQKKIEEQKRQEEEKKASADVASYQVSSNPEEQQALLNEIVWMIPEKQGTVISIHDVYSVYKTMRNGGLNSYQAVGLLCNFIRESSLIPNVESPFPACGIAGWTANRAESLAQFSEEMGDQPYNVKGYQIGGLETQAAFAAAEAYTGEKTGPAAKVGWIMYMGRPVFGKWIQNLDQQMVLDMTLDKSIDFTQGLTPDLWNSMQCPLACYLYAYTNFELGETTLDVMARGGNCAIPLHELLTSIETMEG